MNEWLKSMGWLWVTGLALVLILGTTEALGYRVFGTINEQSRRLIFEESKAYRQGNAQEFQNMQFGWTYAKDQEQKDALASIILHKAADVDLTTLPVDVANFIQSLRNGGAK